MKTYAAAASALTLLLLSFAYANQPQKTSADADSVRAVVTDYIESYYTADAARLERSLHPHYLKHTISGSGADQRMTEKTGLQMLQDVRNGQPIPQAHRGQQITVLDVNGDIASAKLVTPGWSDYLTLSKWNGKWKIVSVVLREN
jgi:Putative lumazine-binding